MAKRNWSWKSKRIVEWIVVYILDHGYWPPGIVALPVDSIHFYPPIRAARTDDSDMENDETLGKSDFELEEMGLVYCTSCKQYKPRRDFSADNRKANGLQSHCKCCIARNNKRVYRARVDYGEATISAS